MRKIANIEYLDAVTGKIKKVGDLIEENSKLKFKLKQIEDFMTYEFSGENEWVKLTVLKIIKKG